MQKLEPPLDERILCLHRVVNNYAMEFWGVYTYGQYGNSFSFDIRFERFGQ